MKIGIGLVMGLAGLLGASLVAAEEASSEATAAARHVAVTICATCHGPQGHAISPKFPQLAGQRATYLVAQMKNFRSQSRGDPDALAYMWGMAAGLDDDLINGLAAYYSAQQPARGERSDPALIARGREIFANGVAAEGIPPCASCHGPEAAGADDFPRLAGQRAQYLLKQLRSFQNNMRNVAIMHGVASGLQSSEMNAVTAYLQSLGTR